MVLMTSDEEEHWCSVPLMLKRLDAEMTACSGWQACGCPCGRQRVHLNGRWSQSKKWCAGRESMSWCIRPVPVSHLAIKCSPRVKIKIRWGKGRTCRPFLMILESRAALLKRRLKNMHEQQCLGSPGESLCEWAGS